MVAKEIIPKLEPIGACRINLSSPAETTKIIGYVVRRTPYLVEVGTRYDLELLGDGWKDLLDQLDKT
jgi:hypothetical protein